jgi:HlyD family secretion protein
VPPCAQVTAQSVILELSNPQIEQQAINAQLALQSAEAWLENLRVELRNQRLTQESQIAAIESDDTQAQMEAGANKPLTDQKLVSMLVAPIAA